MKADCGHEVHERFSGKVNGKMVTVYETELCTNCYRYVCHECIINLDGAPDAAPFICKECENV